MLWNPENSVKGVNLDKMKDLLCYIKKRWRKRQVDLQLGVHKGRVSQGVLMKIALFSLW